MTETSPSAPTPTRSALSDGAAVVDALTVGLLADLAGPDDADHAGDLVLSPFSVAAALGMALAGASGGTEREMARVLGDLPPERIHAGLAAVTTHLAGLAGPVVLADGTDDEVALSPANAVYAQAGLPWQRAFLDLLDSAYSVEPHAADFRGAPEQARGEINHWVAQRTADRIPELVPAGAVDADTRLVLVNALHLKAPWATQFEEAHTRPGRFTTAEGREVEVPMMRSVGAASGHAEVDGARVVRLPYATGRLAMTVVLPPEGEEAALRRRLGERGWRAYAGAEVAGEVDLTMPRWEARTQAELGDALARLGMASAFSGEDADFSAMTPEDRLAIAAVVHEGWVAVGEAGTEAAAATAVMMRLAGAVVRVEREEVVLDRPFAWCVHDVEHGVPVFVGWVADPSE
ncbi:serpin family protein [Nocardioides zeae]|uniref:Serpin family protein n=1 Tax=Nocardioides imazamoxiresistens TaxID=3231893 RepID=A0ABU3Q1F5_9ACTN|nr:serpin family protein [Nocardioides zeae]MDT9595346.1 serpin family protein [Nocardioides zeae]